jgi:2,4-diaminopentanoate dehydrogenase
MGQSQQTLRVIQCGTGVAGRQALRAILGNRSMCLVGLLVHGESRSGQDAALIAGLDDAGSVRATDSFEEILRTEADAVCYMMLLPDLERICALLESGKNVVTTAGLMFPRWSDETAAARLERACARGKSSFHVTGINPGWVDEVLPLTMSALCRDIRSIHIREYADCARYPAPHILNVMGFGRSLEDVRSGRLPDLAIMRDFFTQSIAALAEGLRLQLDEITESREFALAPHAYDIAAGHIPAGSIAGQRWRWQGIAGGVPRIVQETWWITAFDLGEDWPRAGALDNDTQWRVTIEGTPSLRCTFEPRYSFLHGAARPAPDFNPSGLATAMAAVNSLHALCAAPPGIRLASDLPLPRCRQIAA